MKMNQTHRHYYVAARGVHCWTITAGPLRENRDGTVTIYDHDGNPAFRLPRVAVEEVASDQEAQARCEHILAAAAERN